MYTPFNTDPTVNSSRHSLLPVKESNDNVFTSLNWAMFPGSGKNNHYIYIEMCNTLPKLRPCWQFCSKRSCKQLQTYLIIMSPTKSKGKHFLDKMTVCTAFDKEHTTMIIRKDKHPHYRASRLDPRRMTSWDDGSVRLQVLDDFDVLSMIGSGAAVVATFLQVLEFVLKHLALPLLVFGQPAIPMRNSFIWFWWPV